MKKKDILVGLVIGCLIGILALATIKNIESVIQERFSWFNLKMIYPLPLIMPILAVIGLFAAQILAKKIKTIWQFAKFALVGALNTFVDLGILNLLIFLGGAGVPQGMLYGFFKFISFSAAATNSYFWNKSWTFEKGGQIKGKEFAGFYLATGVGALINVGVALFFVKITGPLLGMNELLWAGIIAPFIGVFAGFIWNFLAYKFIIFKK